MCVLDEHGRSDFDQLMERARARRRKPGMPLVAYCVFDLLALEGESVMHLPFRERRSLLQTVLARQPERLLYVQSIDREGDWLYRQACILGLEGIVSKRLDSPYEPGTRSPAWVKRKRPGATPAQRFSRGPNKSLEG